MVSWTRDASEVLISLYEKQPCLYSTSSPHYHNRNKRHFALEHIALQLQGVRPGTTAPEVKRKLNGIRTQFLDACGKVEASKKSGCPPDSIYVPSLWCFPSLYFLKEHTVHKGDGSFLDVSSYSSTQNGNIQEPYQFNNGQCKPEPMHDVEDDNDAFEDILSPSRSSTSLSGTSNKNPQRPKRRVPPEQTDELYKEACSALEAIKNNPRTSKEADNLDIFGQLITAELRTIKCRTILRSLKSKIMCAIMDSQEEDDVKRQSSGNT